MHDLQFDRPSGYPYVAPETMQWIVELLESRAEDPGDIQFVGRHRDGLDLEIVFAVAPRSKSIFTEAVCLEIAQEVAGRTGVLGPLVYIFDDPHPTAQAKLPFAFTRA